MSIQKEIDNLALWVQQLEHNANVLKQRLSTIENKKKKSKESSLFEKYHISSLDEDQYDVGKHKLSSNVAISYHGSTLYDNGIVYKHGYGEEMMTGGVIYKGMFRRDRYHGVGMQIFPDGKKWIGEWIEGHKYKGTLHMPDGSVHLQQWEWDPKMQASVCTKKVFQAVSKRNILII